MIPKQFYEDPKRPEVLRLLREDEWRGIGITQSLGWEHYEVHGEFVLVAISPYWMFVDLSTCLLPIVAPEPHVLLFRRPKNYVPPTIDANGHVRAKK